MSRLIENTPEMGRTTTSSGLNPTASLDLGRHADLLDATNSSILPKIPDAPSRVQLHSESPPPCKRQLEFDVEPHIHRRHSDAGPLSKKRRISSPQDAETVVAHAFMVDGVADSEFGVEEHDMPMSGSHQFDPGAEHESDETVVTPPTRSAWANFSKKEETRLSDYELWLNDEVINTFLTTIAAPFTDSLAVTPYDTIASESAVSTIVEGSNGQIRQLVIIQCQSNNHWVTRRVRWGINNDDNAETPWVDVETYDSVGGILKTSTPAIDKDLEQARAQAMKLLPPQLVGAVSSCAVRNMPTPQQSNSNDCGIYALVVAWCLLAHQNVPDQLDPTVWRCMFLSIARADAQQGSKLQQLLPNVLINDLDDFASFKESDPITYRRSSALDEIAHMLKAAGSWRKSLRIRTRAAKNATLCVQTQMVPLVYRWQEAVSAAKGVLEERCQDLVAMERDLDGVLESARRLQKWDFLRKTDDNVAKEVEASKKRVAKVKFSVQVRLGAIGEASPKLLWVAGDLKDTIAYLSARQNECKKLNTAAKTAFANAAAEQDSDD